MFTRKMTVALRVLVLLDRSKPGRAWRGDRLRTVHGLHNTTLHALHRSGVIEHFTRDGHNWWNLSPKTLAIIDAVRA